MELWAAWKAGAAALRGPLVVGLVVCAFVLGGVASARDSQPRTIRVPAVSDDALNRLTAALEANTAQREPSDPTIPAVTTAASVVESVEAGEVLVVPEAAPPTTTTTTASPPTTTLPTTTTDPVIRFEPHG